MRKFTCIVPEDCPCNPGEACVVLVMDGSAEPECCPYRIWSGVESPEWAASDGPQPTTPPAVPPSTAAGVA